LAREYKEASSALLLAREFCRTSQTASGLSKIVKGGQANLKLSIPRGATTERVKTELHIKSHSTQKVKQIVVDFN